MRSSEVAMQAVRIPLLCALITGCTSDTGDTGGPSSSSSDATETGETTTASTSATTEPVTSGTSTAGESTGNDVDPPDEPVSFYYSVVGVEPDLTWGCTVADIAGGSMQWEVTLACSDDGPPVEAVLTLMASPALAQLPVSTGDVLTLRYEEAMPFWIESAVRIEDENGTLLLAAARGSGALDPFSPQHVDRGALLETHTDECGTSRDYAVDVDLGDGASGSLKPPEYGNFGAYAVWAVDEDTLDLADGCYDLPWAWEEILVVRTGPV